MTSSPTRRNNGLITAAKHPRREYTHAMHAANRNPELWKARYLAWLDEKMAPLGWTEDWTEDDWAVAIPAFRSLYFSELAKKRGGAKK